MQSLKSYLEARFAGAKRLAILGAGSVLKADDAAGCVIVENLKAIVNNPNVLLCVGETAPENYSGKICAFQPTHVLLLDAADVGGVPGEVVEINPSDVGGPTFCSHMLPLRIMVSYIVDQTGADTALLGIQYQSIAFDAEMTAPVKAAVDALTGALAGFIGENL